jgi:hypothetical protein
MSINHNEKAVWRVFSKFIRARDANWQGYCQCISCSTQKNWKEMDAGHYISVGSDRALKYNELNVNAQCTSCNKFKSGNLINYRRGLISKVGEKEVERLEQSHFFKTTKKKLNQLELNAMFDYYNKEFKKLAKQKCL